MLLPYELPQIVAQIPPSPMNVPMPIQKALATEGENKTIHLDHQPSCFLKLISSQLRALCRCMHTACNYYGCACTSNLNPTSMHIEVVYHHTQ